MKKLYRHIILILAFVLMFFTGSHISLVKALDINLGSISDPSHLLHKFGTDTTGSGTYELLHRQDGGYFVRQGGTVYDYSGINQGQLQKYIPPTYNNNYMVYIKTQRFDYFITNEVVGEVAIHVYDKINNAFYTQTIPWIGYAYDYQPFWFFLNGKLYWSTSFDTNTILYNYFDHDPTDTSILGSFEIVDLSDKPQIQYIFNNKNPSGAERAFFTGSDTGSTLYTLEGSQIYQVQFVDDATLGIVRGEGYSTAFENNTFDWSITGNYVKKERITNYAILQDGLQRNQFYNLKLIDDKLFVSIGRHQQVNQTSGGTYDANNLKIETLSYNLTDGTWTLEYPDNFILSYNSFLGKGYLITRTLFETNNLRILNYFGPAVLVYNDIENNYLRKSWGATDGNFYTSTDAIPEEYIDGEPGDPGAGTGTTDPTDPTDDGTGILGNLTGPLTTFFGGVNDSYNEVTGGKQSIIDGSKDLINNFDDFDQATTNSGTSWDPGENIDPSLQNVLNGFNKMDTGQNDFLTAWYNALKYFIYFLLLIGIIAFLIFKFSD